MEAERRIPYDSDAEQGLIGSCLLSPDAIDKAQHHGITAESFYNPANRLIFEALLDLSANNIAIDLITLGDRLRARGSFQDVGGAPYINEIFDRIETPGLINEYIRIVRNNAVLRRLIHISQQTIEDIGSGSALADSRTTDDLIAMVEQRLYPLTSSSRSASAAMHISYAAGQVERMMHDAAANVAVPQLITPFPSLNQKVMISPKKLVYLAARPGIGKTTIALNIVQHIARNALRHKTGEACLIFSLEMGADELTERIAGAIAGVDMLRVKQGFCPPQAHQRLTQALALIKQLPIIIDDTPGLTVEQMRSRARRVKRKQPLSLVVIDYLQLMTPSGDTSRKSTNDQYAHISRNLKITAKELEIPVIALAQLNRESEKQQREPRMSDLRDCGNLEQDADAIVIFQQNNSIELCPTATDKCIHTYVDGFIVKNRSGPLANITFDFNKSHSRYTELDRYATQSQ